MIKNLIVRGAPQEYNCCNGAWQELPSHLKRRQLDNILILHGRKSWQAAKAFFPDLSDFTTEYVYFGGECTDEQADLFVQQIKKQQINAVVAVGGGKVADLAKLTAHLAQIPVLILPTLAATCAAYTPLSVVYHTDGSMDRYDIFPVSNALVLIEPKIILDSPIELMIAGIGDTLAKWYEAHTIIGQINERSIEITIAEYAAKQCQEVLLKDSEAALSSMKKGEISRAFLNVLETIILLGGMVGGFGDEYGRTAGAHSIHDALTILPASHHQLHGNKVAYGVLVQLVIENKWQEIDKLLVFYQKLNLPFSLKSMKMQLTADQYHRVAIRASAEDETIHYMKEQITPTVVQKAMNDLEHYTKDFHS